MFLPNSFSLRLDNNSNYGLLASFPLVCLHSIFHCPQPLCQPLSTSNSMEIPSADQTLECSASPTLSELKNTRNWRYGLTSADKLDRNVPYSNDRVGYVLRV